MAARPGPGAGAALSGAKPEAERSLQALRVKYPDLTLAQVLRDFPPLTNAYRDRVVEALQDVGLPA